jgi:plastocyanin
MTLAVTAMWRIGVVLSLLFWDAEFLAPAQAGEISGRIVISRTLTKKRVVVPNYDLRALPVASQPRAAGSDVEYSRLVIYLENPSENRTKTAVTKLVQQDLRFQPEVVVVPVGSTVSFPNGDPIFHNVFSLSPVKPFDLGYYPEGETRKITFDRVGVVQVYCHLHTDMSAAIVVVPNSWFAQPGPSGKFLFSEVPAGRYNVVVWHKSAGFFRKSVAVSEGRGPEILFDIPVREETAP